MDETEGSLLTKARGEGVQKWTRNGVGVGAGIWRGGRGGIELGEMAMLADGRGSVRWCVQ
jgi:hypothetical protein